MSELLKSAISEIDYALVSNKGGKEVREHYLNNAKRYINEAEKEQEIQLNEEQQIVLEFLKNKNSVGGYLSLTVTSLTYLVWDNQLGGEYEKIRSAYFRLTRKQEAEVLQAFARWGLSNDK